jgi:hypothetical protein
MLSTFLPRDLLSALYSSNDLRPRSISAPTNGLFAPHRLRGGNSFCGVLIYLRGSVRLLRDWARPDTQSRKRDLRRTTVNRRKTVAVRAIPALDAVGQGCREMMGKSTPTLPCRKRATPIAPRFETSETESVTVSLRIIFCGFPSSYNNELRMMRSPTSYWVTR